MTRRIDIDRADFATRRAAHLKQADSLAWPVDTRAITRIGDTVTLDRNGQGRPHDGVDLFVPAGTEVVSAARGTVTAVKDGRFSSGPHLKRAGLFVEVTAPGKRLYRYLHLGSVAVKEGQHLSPRDLVGVVAPAHTSGLGEEPHLHFEVREAAKAGEHYGRPINPLMLLPKKRA